MHDVAFETKKVKNLQQMSLNISQSVILFAFTALALLGIWQLSVLAEGHL